MGKSNSKSKSNKVPEEVPRKIKEGVEGKKEDVDLPQDERGDLEALETKKTASTVIPPTPPLQAIWKSRRDVVHTSVAIKRSNKLNGFDDKDSNINNNDDNDVKTVMSKVVEKKSAPLERMLSPMTFMKERLSKFFVRRRTNNNYLNSSMTLEDSNNNFMKLPLSPSKSRMRDRLGLGLRPSTGEMPLVKGESEDSIIIMMATTANTNNKPKQVTIQEVKGTGGGPAAAPSFKIIHQRPKASPSKSNLKTPPPVANPKTIQPSKGPPTSSPKPNLPSPATKAVSKSNLPAANPSRTAAASQPQSKQTLPSTIGSTTTASTNFPAQPSNPSVASTKQDPKNNPSKAKREPFHRGCCGPVPPPAYLDYNYCSGSGGYSSKGGRCSNRNPILDRLKNVDVIEELQYNVPGADPAGDSKVENEDDEFDYFYVCTECGERTEADICCPKGSKKQSKTNPVTYSRRQRFNFTSTRNACSDEEDGPPFKWPANACRCLCCVAGLRRNPNCCCKCCMQKGKDRTFNPFDEIPVGKNPEPKDLQEIQQKLNKEEECESESESDSGESSEDLYPKESGVYFYDANTGKFVRQIPRTPTPCVIPAPTNESQSATTPAQAPPAQQTPRDPGVEMDRINNMLGNLPPRSVPKKRPPQCSAVPIQPIVLPAIYGPCDQNQDMTAYCEAALNCVCPEGCAPNSSKGTSRKKRRSSNSQPNQENSNSANKMSSQEQEARSKSSPNTTETSPQTLSGNRTAPTGSGATARTAG